MNENHSLCVIRRVGWRRVCARIMEACLMNSAPKFSMYTPNSIATCPSRNRTVYLERFIHRGALLFRKMRWNKEITDLKLVSFCWWNRRVRHLEAVSDITSRPGLKAIGGVGNVPPIHCAVDTQWLLGNTSSLQIKRSLRASLACSLGFYVLTIYSSAGVNSEPCVRADTCWHNSAKHFATRYLFIKLAIYSSEINTVC